MTDDRLSADKAAEIAKRHGLSLSDALALRGLTDDAAEADALAAKFTGNSDDGDDSEPNPRELARDLPRR